MTLDLDELERLAKAWLAGDEWLREHTHDWSNGRAHPGVVLALIERVRELNGALDDRTRELQAALKVIGGGK